MGVQAMRLASLASTTKLGVMLTFAVVCALVAGMIGAMVGTCCGLAVGALLAIFTLGISIPVCGFLGLGVGAAAGALLGGASGAAIGYAGFQYRKEVHQAGQDAHSGSAALFRSLGTKVKDSATRLSATMRSMAGSTVSTQEKEH